MPAADLLTDVRVVDLTDAYGSFAAKLLADLGAEVVRIESEGGSRGRARRPRAQDGTSLHYLQRNLGKSIVSSAGSALDGLLAGADIAFCSDDLPAGSAQELASRHPHLVVVAMTPFGLEGPTAGWHATELVAQSLAGVVYRSGVAELPPVSAPGSYCEDVGAAVGALAGVLALRHVRRGGSGQLIDLSTILALAHCTDMSLPLWSLLRFSSARAGAGLYPLFACTDGLARLVLPMSPGEWRSLIAWLGSPPEWTGTAWEKAMLGPEERDAIVARLPEKFAAGTRAELAADGDASGLRITPVLTPAEVLSNEHSVGRGTFTRVSAGEGLPEIAVTAGLFGINGVRAGATAPPDRNAEPPVWPARSVAPSAGASGAPLAGVRVLEIGSGVAAPEAGRFLSEWGADVIKVESANRPDFQRRVMGGDMNPAFSSPNRNKRGLAADLGTEAGRELVRRMLPKIDVIIENNATGVIDRLGLGWDAVRQINPRLVMVNTQLYGNRGPWASKKGYGPSARAIGGLTWLWAHGPDAPRGVMTIHPDHLAGRLVALGVLAGLHARERTGEGARIDLAQFETVIALLGDLLATESIRPGAAQPAGNRSPDSAPWNVYRCADGEGGIERWLAVCVPDDATWQAFLSALPGEFDRPQWRTAYGRLGDVETLDEALASWLREEDPETTEEALQAAGVPAGQLLSMKGHAEHLHFVGRGYPVPVDQPGSGPLLLEGPAFAASSIGVSMGVPRCEAAPMLGQHTAEVCRDVLGLGDAAIADLVAAGAIDPLPVAVDEVPSPVSA
ncbi:MAG TPA: CoA transferase [Frankiaceae bacterium]|nr:CoA transferase [Frankiaceae bacterium]